MLSSDLQDFTQSYANGDWEAAAVVYKGPFLSTLFIDDCIVFDHWVELCRSEKRSLAENVLEELCIDSAWAQAVGLAEVLLRDDPDNARVWALGNRAARHDQDTGFSKVPDPFGSQPSPEVLSFWDQTADRSEAAGSKGKSVPFVGREQELAALKLEITKARSAGPRVVLVEGEPGIGKTALVVRFAKARILRGDLGLVARASQIERNVPFAVIDQWLRAIPQRYLSEYAHAPWSEALGRVFPGVYQAPRSGEFEGTLDYRSILEALRRLFTTLSTQQPLVLCVDDAHLIDTASLGLLAYLTRREGATRILVILTGRAGDSEKLWDFAHQFEPFRLHLGALSAPDVDQWLRRTGITSSTDREEMVPALLARTGGNPLLISSLLEGGRDLRQEDFPFRLFDYFSPKLQEVSSTATSALTALSIIGAAVSLDMLHRILQVSLATIERAVRELANSGLVTVIDGTVRVRHNLIADVALSLASDHEKRRLHGRTARLYSDAEPSAAAFAAVSYDIAGAKPDAYAAARQAAQACAVLNAQTERIYFLKLAIGNAPAVADAVSARLELSEAWLLLGEGQQALDCLSDRWTDGASQDLRRRIALQRLRAGIMLASDDEALRNLWKEAQGLTEGGDFYAVAGLYSEIGALAHDLGSHVIATDTLKKTRKILQRLPASIDKDRLLLRPILSSGLSGDCYEALTELACLEHPRAGDADYACKYLAARGSLLVSAARLLAAEDDFTKALFIAERYGLYSELFLIHNNLGVTLTEQGRYGEAEDALVRAQEYAPVEAHPTQFSVANDNVLILCYESARYEEVLERTRGRVVDRTAAGRRSLLTRYSLIGLAYLKMGRLADAREVHRELLIQQRDRDRVRTDLSYLDIFNARILIASDRPHNAIEHLINASGAYSSSLYLARFRLQLESYRIRAQLGLSLSGIEDVAKELSTTGAVPLIAVADRLKHRRNRT